MEPDSRMAGSMPPSRALPSWPPAAERPCFRWPSTTATELSALAATGRVWCQSSCASANPFRRQRVAAGLISMPPQHCCRNGSTRSWLRVRSIPGVPACDHPGDGTQPITDLLEPSFRVTIRTAGHRHAGEVNPPATRHNLANRHGSREVVLTGDQQHMANAISLKVIHQRCEISQRVPGSIIQRHPIGIKALLFKQPLGIFTIAATTHQEWKIQLASQTHSHPLPIHIPPKNQHQLRWSAIQQGLPVGGHGAWPKEPDR